MAGPMEAQQHRPQSGRMLRPATSYLNGAIAGVVENPSASCAVCGAADLPVPQATRGESSRGFRVTRDLSAFTAALLLLFTVAVGLATPVAAAPHFPGSSLRNFARQATTSLLEVFQIYPPVLTVTPDDTLKITDGSSNASVAIVNTNRQTCQQTLLVHDFAYSYGQPYVGPYSPPDCSFNRVTWNLTVESAGRQYDRLGIVYLGDIEVFRTSTAEPTQDGIEWTYLKDMTSYVSLFKEQQKIIFDLGNLVNSVYTGIYNVTLTAAYFTAEDSITPADLILPISARQAAENMPSVFTVPPNTASNDLTLPRNVKKAVFTVAATGQSEEEFWWSNVPQSTIDTFPSYGELYGYSPFREVQLFIDGDLAGVAWPFPIIFTGGVVPGLWRPIVGIDAFDLKEDEIDITPWLPLLCDGNAHNFTIRVSGLNDNGNGQATLSETTDSYWLVTGKVFVWYDQEGHITTGNGPSKDTPAPNLQVTTSIGKSANGTNETLYYEVRAQRSLSFSSTLHLSHGSERATWSQSLSFSNIGNFTDQGNVEVNTQQTTGYDVSSSGYARHISYPLYAYSVFETFGDNISYAATVNRGKDVQSLGQQVFPSGLETFSAAAPVAQLWPQFEGAWLSTTQDGNATFVENTTSLAAYSFGTTTQDMTFAGIRVNGQPGPQGFPGISSTHELFERQAMAVNGSVTEDNEVLVGDTVPHDHGSPGGQHGYVFNGLPGRGSHWHGMKQRRRGL